MAPVPFAMETLLAEIAPGSIAGSSPCPSSWSLADWPPRPAWSPWTTDRYDVTFPPWSERRGPDRDPQLPSRQRRVAITEPLPARTR